MMCRFVDMSAKDAGAGEYVGFKYFGEDLSFRDGFMKARWLLEKVREG